MNNKAESTQFIVILTTALILIGLSFVAFSKTPTITAKTTYSNAECYIMKSGEMITSDIEQCCAAIKQSQGCGPYKDDLFLCKGNFGVVVNKETIRFCE
ncbi:TPA: hypothetical protein HA219_00930 [Candidatus Woesearchaeota archaeon]|nr:hypothetical protein [Candidatus Woesearchaeota archaeon]HIH39274.1 hypothetical protein [Candidatus Woesearchaeota archaeon]